MNADGSFSLSTWITGLMFTGGLIAGPGYYFYCVGFSGKNAGEYSIQWQGNSFSPVTVPLDPDMNPIAMEISAYVSGSQSDRAASIGMALDDARAFRLFEKEVLSHIASTPDAPEEDC